VKLLLDMNLSPDWVPFLQQAGIDSTHWSSIGRATAPDVEVMSWARDNGHVVFTNDLDFSALLAMTRAKGRVFCNFDSRICSPTPVGQLVLHVLQQHRDSLDNGAIVTLAQNATRVRVLPLSPDAA
jgi:predicted nuclease of predicted toxin-antitoxin system